MEWIGSGERVPRALALVWYDPIAREWHVADSVVPRAQVEDIDLDSFAGILAIQKIVSRQWAMILVSIVRDHSAKDATKGW